MHYVIVYSVLDPGLTMYRNFPVLRSGTYKDILRHLITSCHSHNKISAIYSFEDLDRAQSLFYSLS